MVACAVEQFSLDAILPDGTSLYNPVDFRELPSRYIKSFGGGIRRDEMRGRCEACMLNREFHDLVMHFEINNIDCTINVHVCGFR